MNVGTPFCSEFQWTCGNIMGNKAAATGRANMF